MLDIEVFLLNVERPFFQSNLGEDIHMKLPLSSGNPNDDIILLLTESLNELLASRLRDFGLEHCHVDPCIFDYEIMIQA